jgi:hypothetical protein
LADERLTGGCACGEVRFDIAEPLVGALYCHCKRCQRRTGTAFSVSGATAPGSFRFVAGEDLVSVWDPGDGGWEKLFCNRCGGHLASRREETLSVRFGALDGDPGIRPAAHQFVTYAAPWEPLPDDGLPRYPERAG